MNLIFEWDAVKARSNIQKHGVSFEEATTVFGDTRAITIKETNVRGEQRYVTVGLTSSKSLIIVVVHTDRNDRIRIISARPANKYERKQYTSSDI